MTQTFNTVYAVPAHPSGNCEIECSIITTSGNKILKRWSTKPFVITTLYTSDRGAWIEKIEDIVNRNVLSLYSRIFKVESPARRLMQHLLSRFICYGETVPGTLLDRVVSMGESPIKRAFNYKHVPQSSATNDGLVDSIRHLLFTDNFNRPYSHEHLLVHLLTTAL